MKTGIQLVPRDLHIFQSCSSVSVNLNFQDEGHRECMFIDTHTTGAANPFHRAELQPLWQLEIYPAQMVCAWSVGTTVGTDYMAQCTLSHPVLSSPESSRRSISRCHLTVPKENRWSWQVLMKLGITFFSTVPRSMKDCTCTIMK